jgi:hypothetical protein
VSPLKYELGLYIPEDDVLHSHRRENLKSYSFCWFQVAALDVIPRTGSIWTSPRRVF